MRKLVEFWHPRGVIVAEKWTKGPCVQLGEIPVVFFDCSPKCVQAGKPTVMHPTRPLCEVVVREFLSIGCESVAYVGWYRNEYWSEDRVRHLKGMMELHGLPFFSFKMDQDCSGDPYSLNVKLRKWVATLPRNCGVFTVNDIMAEPLINAVYACGMSIPDDIAVIGVGDDEFLDERLSPTLTSVKLEYDALAERTMSILAGDGNLPSLDAMTMRLIRRQSTRRFRRHDKEVENAVERIRKEACGGLAARDIFEGFSCSRRMAEIRFKSITGQSVIDAIIDARLEKCRELLANSRTPIKIVADRCGFPSAFAMREQFARRMKTTPQKWRTEHRLQQGVLASMRKI